MNFHTYKRAVFSFAAGLFAMSLATQAAAFCFTNDLLSREQLHVRQMLEKANDGRVFYPELKFYEKCMADNAYTSYTKFLEAENKWDAIREHCLKQIAAKFGYKSDLLGSAPKHTFSYNVYYPDGGYFDQKVKADKTKCCSWKEKSCNPSGRKDGKINFEIASRFLTMRGPSSLQTPHNFNYRIYMKIKATDHVVCRTSPAVGTKGFKNPKYKGHSRKTFELYGPKCKVYSWPHSPPKHFSKTQRGRLIQSLHSGKCLDVFKGNKKNGANVGLWKCHGKKNQRWTLHHQGYIRSALNGKCLDVKGAGKVGKNGANVMMWDCHGGKNQTWRSRGSYRGMTQLVSLAPGASQWCLDIKGGKTSNGANAQIWKCQNTRKLSGPHRWMVTNKPVTIRSIQNRFAGKCVDSTKTTKKGTKIHTWACNKKNANQKWFLKKRSGTYYEIKSANSGLCLDVARASKKNGAKVLQWPCHGKANQQWTFISTGEKGWFRIKSRHSKKCLVLNKDSKKNGTPFKQWACQKISTQTFKWVK